MNFCWESFLLYFCLLLSFPWNIFAGKMIESVYLWSWVSIWRYWLVHGGTGLEYGGTSWELLEMGQNMAMLAVTWWKMVLKGGTGCYLVVLDQNRVVQVASVIAF